MPTVLQGHCSVVMSLPSESLCSGRLPIDPMGVTAFSAADYLVSLCAQLAMLLSYQWLCHCCFRLVRHNLELILVAWLFQASLQQRHSALAARKPVQLLHL